MLFTATSGASCRGRLSATTAHEHLRCLGLITVDPQKRIEAAHHLYDIGLLLGPRRVLLELIPYLADIIDGPASYPLMPPTFIEDVNAMGPLLAGAVAADPKAEAAALSASMIASPSVIEPVIRDIAVNEGRPPLSSIGSTPDTRATLFRAVIGASENDFVFEIIAKQLRHFVPTLVTLQEAVLVIGLLCQLASSAEVTVRDEAVVSILEILKQFDNKTLLSSGCVDLFLGMATSDNPYKKASVAYLLPPLLSTLSGYKAEDEEAVRPLKTEIVKLFFDFATGTSTVSRRAFALNFGSMAMAQMMQPSNFKYNPLSGSKAVTNMRQSAAVKLVESMGLAGMELELCLIPYAFLEDPNPEMRLLAIPLMVTSALILFLKYARPPNFEWYPTLSCLFRKSDQGEATSPYEARDHAGPHRSKECINRCPHCQFSWTTSSNLCGVFSLSTSPLFESLRYAIACSGYSEKAMTFSVEANAPAYRKLVTEVIMPVFQRSLVDEWITRVVLIDSFPFLLDIVLSQLSCSEVEAYIESNWLAILADDEHTDVRAVALQKFALHAWLYSQSTSRGCLELRSQKIGVLNSTDDVVVSAIPWPPEYNTFDGLNRFIDRCSHIVQAAASDSDNRLRLAAADIAPQFLLMLAHPPNVADYFVTPFLSLLRDLDQHVVLSTLGGLKILTWSNLAKKDEKERDQETLFVKSLCTRLPVGIRSPLLPRHVRMQDFLPFKKETTLNDLEVTRKYIALIERSMIPAITHCLEASTTSQISGEAPPSIVPMWRVRCATLHLLPMLDEITSFTDNFNLNDDSRPYFADLVAGIRNALGESTAVVRRCAASATLELCMKAHSAVFASILYQPIFKQCLLRHEQPVNSDQGNRITRLSICLIGDALAEAVQQVNPQSSRDRKLTIMQWSPELYKDLIACLKIIENDKVSNTRMLATNALKNLTLAGMLGSIQSKIIDS